MLTTGTTYRRSSSVPVKEWGFPHQSRGLLDAFKIVRRIAILACFLVEGAIPILPREVFLGLACLSVAIVTFLSGGIDRRVLPLFTIPVFVLVISLTRQSVDLDSVSARFINFCTALALLGTYLKLQKDRPQQTLSIFEADLYFVLRLFAYQAIATFALGYAAPFLFRSVHLGFTEYKSAFYVLNYHMMYLDRTIRPDGLFYERGIFQLFLNIFLYIALIRKGNLIHSAIGLAAVATTWSTTGLLCASVIVAYYLFQTIRSGKATWAVLLLPLVVAIIIPFYVLVHSNANAKFSGSERGSFLVRQSDFNAGVSLIKEAPLLGLGFDDAQITQRMRKYIVYIPGIPIENLMTRSISNGVIRMTLALGIPLALLHFWGLAHQGLFRHRWIIFLLVTATLLSESIPFNPFLLCIMYSGLVPQAAWLAPRSSGSAGRRLSERRTHRGRA